MSPIIMGDKSLASCRDQCETHDFASLPRVPIQPVPMDTIGLTLKGEQCLVCGFQTWCSRSQPFRDNLSVKLSQPLNNFQITATKCLVFPASAIDVTTKV